MAYTDDAVLAKLSSLNESQESIVTVAQWVLFHKRHAERTAQLWLQRLNDSTISKKLNLIYLVNEVTQQSRARRKSDFIVAFSPVIVEAITIAYKGSTADVQLKLRRVVEVWRQRQVFDPTLQDVIEAKIAELEKSRSSGKKTLGGSLFPNSSGSTPPEIQPLVPLQNSVSKSQSSSKFAFNSVNDEFTKFMDPAITVPTPPVHAARLNGLLKSLATAEGAVAESIKARLALIEALEKLLITNRAALSSEETHIRNLQDRKGVIEQKKQKVEDAIMQGFAVDSSPHTPQRATMEQSSFGNNENIDAEELTPPSVEALTPPASTPPPPEFLAGTEPIETPSKSTLIETPVAQDLLSSLSSPYGRPLSGGFINGSASGSKKRKLNVDEMNNFDHSQAMEGLDAEIDELLRTEGRGP
ncbi:MAG: Regulation of nuclear pre-mRNA domain containing protein 1B [Trizodia sp. TS-e1964]|nr:MAG: Regulation of nuclear pre-mRNA domain containing protein 1B [Trizodia sp. TS-e1964]